LFVNIDKTSDQCPCGLGVVFTGCCARWHGGAAAPTAEALMRSRYAAFVVCNQNYLLATWHASTRPTSVAFDGQQKWLGLKVVTASVTSAATAEVEFIARYRIGGGSATRLHERSRFIKEDGRWFYIGDVIS
jgi:SEC-C motif domain protein